MALLDQALAANEEPNVGFYLAAIWPRSGGCAATAWSHSAATTGKRQNAPSQPLARLPGDKGLSSSSVLPKPRSPTWA